jgi:uncharacterized protein
VTALFYLHGFNSSPGTFKGRQLMAHVAALTNPPELYVPALPHRPAQAMAKLEKLIDAVGATDLTLVGSSLGGYYATALAERHGCGAVLINPAIRPYDDLRQYLGHNRNLYTGDEYEITPAHFDELRALRVGHSTRPERYWLLVQTGDEVLDYRQAVAFFAGAKQTVVEGGDHGFQGFERYIADVLAFAGGASPGHVS